jgi:hypothetical protein
MADTDKLTTHTEMQYPESKIKKLKRALSIHRFSQRFNISKDNSASIASNPDPTLPNQASVENNGRKSAGERKIFRRSSLKKFLNRVAQQFVSIVNLGIFMGWSEELR